MSNHPRRIGPSNFELWSGRIELEESQDAAAVQQDRTRHLICEQKCKQVD
jgi:hypothetical protein